MRPPDPTRPAPLAYPLYWRAGQAVAALTFALAVALVLRTTQAGLLLHLYLSSVGLIALIALLAWVGEAFPSARRVPRGGPWRRWRRRSPSQRPRQLERLERAAEFALSTAFDVHYRLRPPLLEVAAQRLAVYRGIDMARAPDAARAALGPIAWELLRPDREPPQDRNAPGIDLPRLRALVRALEDI